jgi:hypothetical protein
MPSEAERELERTVVGAEPIGGKVALARVT